MLITFRQVSRSEYFLCLIGCVFFKVPARGLAAAPRDDGATLSRLLASFETLHEAELQEDDLQPLGENCLDSLSEIGPDNNRLDLGNEQMADELDDGGILSYSCIFIAAIFFLTVLCCT